MAAIILKTIPRFYTKNSEKCLYFPSNANKKYIVCKEYCVANHDTHHLPACKNHIILLGNVEELQKRLDTFCVTYQHVECLFTLLKYRFSGKVIAKSGQVFENVQRAVDFNHRNKWVDRVTSIAKKDFRGKSSKSIYSAPFKRQKQCRPVDHSLQKELKKSERLNLNCN